MKQTFKKAMSVFLVVVMLLCTVPFMTSAVTYSGTCGDNLTWSLDTDTGVLNITGTGAMTNWSYAEAPWYSYYDYIKTVNIASGVTSIGDLAFSSCDSLTSVTIPDSVTTIGEDAFGYCTSLTSVTIPDSVTTIGEWAFYSCDSLTSVTIPDSVTTIGYNAFAYCDSLTSVTIGNSVTTIGEEAFSSCKSLTSIKVASDNKYYSSDNYGVLFNQDKNKLIHYPNGNTRTSYTIPKSVTTIGDNAFSDCNNLTSVTIPDSVTTIGDLAFWYCDNLASVNIPNSVTTIGALALCGCGSLTSVAIPGSVTFIGESAFGGYSGFESISVASDNKYYSSDNYGVLFNKDKTELIQYPVGNTRTSYTIPDSVKVIGEDAFSACNITSVTIPDSVTTIGDFAFRYCYGLKGITIPDSVTTIGDLAFFECSLTDVTIPDSVITIGEYAFAYCKFTSVTIGNNVKTIGDYAFAGNHSPKDVYYNGTQAEWNKISIGEGNEKLTSATIHFKDVDYSGMCGDNLTWLLDTDTGVLDIIGTGAMTDYECFLTPWNDYSSSIKTVNIGNGVTTIGDFAFFACYNLTSCSIPDSVTTIGNCAFAYCESLTNITVDANNKYYSSDSYGVLFNKDKTTLIQYPIGNTGTSYTIPDSVTTIYTDAFLHSTTLTSVTIPDSVTTIGNSAFSSCYSLTDVYYTGTKEQWKKISIDSDNEPLTNATIRFAVELKLKQPSTTTINYGDTLVLHLEDVELSEGYAIEWSIIGDAATISASEDGKECRVTSTAGGNVSVIATLIDENGEHAFDNLDNEISTFINLKSNVNFWLKIVSFFKNLFGINRVIDP